jgi:phytoene dehydrogenase-like protein
VFAVSPVESIITEKTSGGSYRAVGVRVHGVDVLARKCVVSDAGFTRTFGGTEPLVSREAGESQLSLLREKDGKLSLHPSPAFFYLFVGLDGSDEELEVPAQNIWQSKDWDHQSALDELFSKESIADVRVEDTPLVFLSNESAKDPDYQKRHPGKSTVTLIAWTKSEWFNAWKNTTHGHRGEDYEKVKAEMEKFLLGVLYKHFPKTKGRVAFTELGTPLSTNKYLGRETGEIYNLDHDISRFGSFGAQLALHPQTKVKNLYLTGQDVLAVSIEGATLSSMLTAGRISTLAFIFYSVPFALMSLLPFTFLN